MEIRNEINQILRDWKYEAVNTNEAIDSILRLFSVSKRFNSNSFLTGFFVGITIALIIIHFSL